MKENKIMERKRIKRGICIVKEGEEESEACGTPLSHYFHFAKHHGPSSCRCSLIHIKRTHDIIRRVSAPVYANSHFAPPQKVVRIPFCLPTPPPRSLISSPYLVLLSVGIYQRYYVFGVCFKNLWTTRGALVLTSSLVFYSPDTLKRWGRLNEALVSPKY